MCMKRMQYIYIYRVLCPKVMLKYRDYLWTILDPKTDASSWDTSIHILSGISLETRLCQQTTNCEADWIESMQLWRCQQKCNIYIETMNQTVIANLSLYILSGTPLCSSLKNWPGVIFSVSRISTTRSCWDTFHFILHVSPNQCSKGRHKHF